MTHFSLGHIRYNAGAEAFEALVDVQYAGQTYGYPCAVAGPLTMKSDMVRAGLIAEAERRVSGVGALYGGLQPSH